MADAKPKFSCKDFPRITVFGMPLNMNDILSYKTPKFVAIRDWRMGLLRYGLMGAIFGKIIVMTVIYNCKHLKPVPVHGIVKATIQQPTVDDCDPLQTGCHSNFRPLSEISYCAQYKPPQDDARDDAKDDARGDAKDDAKDEGKSKEKRMLKDASETKPQCELFDGIRMTRGRSPVPGTIFIPTRLSQTKQKTGCVPKAPDWACETRPWVNTGGNPPDIYVADVENFRIKINHAFVLEGCNGQMLTGRAGDFEGSFTSNNAKEVEDNVVSGHAVPLMERIKELLMANLFPDPKPEKIIIPLAPDEDSAFPSLDSTDRGDIIHINDLIKAADPTEGFLDEERPGLGTRRYDGMVLFVTVKYSNYQKLDPFADEPPHYTLTANMMPMKSYNVWYPNDDGGPGTRTVMDVHGILIYFQVAGDINVFDLNHMLQVFTTALVTLSLSVLAADMIMVYCPGLPNKKYEILKYQPSQDFGKVKGKLDELQKKPGYDQHKNKAFLHADILTKWTQDPDAMGIKDKTTSENLLAVLLKIEQRLNRLDGMDESFAIFDDGDNTSDGPCADFLKKKHQEIFLAPE